MKRLTHVEVKHLQQNLNYFTNKFLKGIAPLIVDGNIGHATYRRIRMVRYWLGYKRENLDSVPTLEFRRQLRVPKSFDWSDPGRVARGIARRHAQRRKWAKNLRAATKASGVTTYDGRPVARWFVPYMEYARNVGDHTGRWHGTLNSGWRDPVYSEHLCYQMCGAPSCPGRCAGRASNHVGSTPGTGAIDVSDYVTFARIMRNAPYNPKIFNALGAQDPVHFSPSGR